MGVPIFVVYTHKTSNMHISAGIQPKTLCEKKDIESSAQIDKRDLKNIMSEKNMCEECSNTWDKIKDKINVEQTIECHRCGSTYSSLLARSVESMSDGIVSVCKPCYKELYNDDDSGVDVLYDEAEPFYDVDSDRTCDVSSLID